MILMGFQPWSNLKFIKNYIKLALFAPIKFEKFDFGTLLWTIYININILVVCSQHGIIMIIIINIAKDVANTRNRNEERKRTRSF